MDNFKVIVADTTTYLILLTSYVYSCIKIQRVGVEMSVTRYLASATYIYIQEAMTSAKHGVVRRWTKGGGDPIFHFATGT